MHKQRFEEFLKWCGKSPQQLVDSFENKKARSMILTFQNFLLNEYESNDFKKGKTDKKGLAPNSSKAYITSVRSFYSSQCSPIGGLRGKIKGSKLPIKKEHAFSTNDLRKMWHVADMRNKAILSVGCSLGWEVSAIRGMKREYFENLVKRAREEQLDFIPFEDLREKENALRLGILTPCALDSLERYLEKTKENHNEWLWKNGKNGGRLSPDAFNDLLRTLAREANIALVGKIRFHALRKWLMSRLTDSGMSEWQVKLVVGKSINASDATYLQIKKGTIERYQEAYPEHLSLVAYSNGGLKIEEVQNAVVTLSKDLEGYKTTNKVLNKKIEELEKKAKKVEQLEGEMEKVARLVKFLVSELPDKKKKRA